MCRDLTNYNKKNPPTARSREGAAAGPAAKVKVVRFTPSVALDGRARSPARDLPGLRNKLAISPIVQMLPTNCLDKAPGHRGGFFQVEFDKGCALVTKGPESERGNASPRQSQSNHPPKTRVRNGICGWQRPGGANGLIRLDAEGRDRANQEFGDMSFEMRRLLCECQTRPIQLQSVDGGDHLDPPQTGLLPTPVKSKNQSPKIDSRTEFLLHKTAGETGLISAQLQEQRPRRNQEFADMSLLDHGANASVQETIQLQSVVGGGG